MDIVVEVIPALKDVIRIWVTLFILFKLLEKILYGPVTKFVEDRKNKISGDISEAKRLKEESEAIKREYEKKMEEVRAESQQILADSRNRGEELRIEIEKEARQEAINIKERAKKDIERERAQAFNEIKNETGEMALLIASKIMEREMSLENQDELIDSFIDEVGNSPWQN